jgi:hypothetical protein
VKITVTKARKVKERYDTIGGEEELSAIFHHVTYKRHKLTFHIEMSDGRAYETTHTVNGCNSYHESMWLGDPINDIPQFTRDIESATFPDLVFFDEYGEECDAAEQANDERSVTVCLMYPNDRAKAEQAAIDTLIADIVDEYSAYYFENEDRGIAPYIQKMIDGYAPLI